MTSTVRQEMIRRIASNAIGQIILQQLGNQALKMIGARSIVLLENGVQFKIMKNAKAINTIVINFDEETDTYTVEFWRGSRLAKSLDMVYVDSLRPLITQYTGLYTKL